MSAHGRAFAKRLSALWLLVAAMFTLVSGVSQAAPGDSTNGLALWSSEGCAGCHGTPPDSMRRNAADVPGNTGITVLNRAIAINAGGAMGTFSTTLSVAEREDLVAYIASVFTPSQAASVAFNSSVAISLQDIDVANSTVLTGLATVSGSAPAQGTVSYSPATNTATYTHTASSCTGDSFSYRGSGTGSSITSNRAISITVSAPTLTAGSFSSSAIHAQGATSSVDTAANITNPSSVTLSGTVSLGTPTPNVGTFTGTGATTFTYTGSPAVISIPYSVTGPCGQSTQGTANLTFAGITSATTATATQGAAFTYQTTSTPAATGFSMSAADVTQLTGVGLSFSTTTGAITGTPTIGGVARTVTVNATTSAGTVSQSVAITVLNGGTPVVSAPATANASVGTAVNLAGITATNPEITAASATNLPPGLALGIVDGTAGTLQITGTPTQSQSGGATSNSNVFTAALNATNATGQGADANIDFTVAPNVAPAITGTTLTPSQNVAFNRDVRSNDITNLAVSVPVTNFSATGLPAGLSIDANGVLSGSATESGSFTAQITATNGVGSNNANFTVNVTPTSVPAITSPTAVNGTINTALTPVTVVATNPPITAFGATGLPAGLAIDTSTGVISGTPTANGTFAATLTADNAAGQGSLAVTFTIAAIPASPGTATMTVPLNTPTKLDLAPFISGTGVGGVRVVNEPSFGTATVSGTTVTYTPRTDYFGADSFTYAAFGAAGESTATGRVTVTVVGQPDPSKDRTVIGLIGAQGTTSQRFGRTQISNFQSRLQSLHRRRPSALGRQRNSAALGDNSSSSVATAIPETVGSLSTKKPSARERSSAQAFSRRASPTAGADTPDLPDLSGGESRPAGSGLSQLVGTAVQAATSAVTSRSLNLGAISNGLSAGGDGKPSFEFWMDGNVRFGTRDATNEQSGLEFTTTGISVGADRQFSDVLTLGIGVGVARDKTQIGNDSSRSETRGYSFSMYGSYQPTSNSYVDGIVGIGALQFESKRFVTPIKTLAIALRDGRQAFGSLTAGYEHRNGLLLVSPYGRIDVSGTRLEEATETGVDQFALTYLDETNASIQGSLGVRVESMHSTNFGWASPNFFIEYSHEFRDDREASLRYANVPGGQQFTVSDDGVKRQAVAIGVGTDFTTRNGLTVGLDYRLLHTFSDDRSYTLGLHVAQEFDGLGPSLAQQRAAASSRASLGLNVDFGYVYDDNVTRSRTDGEELPDHIFSINANKTFVVGISPQSRALFTGFLGAEQFRHNDRLSSVHAGVRGELQYRASGAFGSPTFALFGSASVEEFGSELRDGRRNSFGLSILKPITDRLHLFTALTHNERFGFSDVFNTFDNSIRSNIDLTLPSGDTVYVGGEYRRGDVVSTGTSSLENIDIAKVFAADDAYQDREFFSYKFEGKTLLTTVGYNMGLGRRDSLDFSWRWIQSTPDVRPFFATSPTSYYVNQFSAVYLTRF